MDITLPPGGTWEQLKLVENVVLTLMHQHGLTERGWTFRWDRAKVRGGHVVYRKKELTLSPYLHSMWTIEQSVDLILHEIVHAVVGAGHHHDELWRKTARSIGASGNRCWGSMGESSVPYKYAGICPNGHTYYRYRKSRKRQSCTPCSPHGFNAQYLITWKEL